jgi:hypothetical protein
MVWAKSWATLFSQAHLVTLSGNTGPLQGCQIFLDTIYQNGGKCTTLSLNCQMASKQTKLQSNIPNGHKIYYITVPFQGPPQFTQIGIFLFRNHLAALVR